MKKYLILTLAIGLFMSCDPVTERVSTATSGAEKITVNIPKQLDGNTVEQTHVKDRYLLDNAPGSIKHLYIISAYSGQVLIYSTVKSKVTSSGKRLSPATADFHMNGSVNWRGFPINMGDGRTAYTSEMLGDDGTYGSSGDYIYWWDSKNVYHQQYITGGMILHISSQPLAVKSIILNMEIDSK